jgi:hypothetical protein
MTSVGRESEEPRKAKRTSIRNIILVAAVTVYTGALAITNAHEAWHKGAPFGTAFIVMVVLLAAVATYGAIVLLRMLILFRRGK